MQDRYSGALGVSKKALGWLRVLNILYGIGVAALLILSLVAAEFLFRALGVRETGWGTTTLSMRGIMVVGVAGAFIAHQILTGLLQIVESVRAGDPFVLNNAARLQAIAWWLLVAELLHIVVGVLARLASTPAQRIDLDWSFSFTPWIAVLLLFVLARVFAHGARMREDLEGTV